ncbi:conjugal transfer protein TraF [Thiosulfativibrio zosterae]|uniref:Conjugal transfer protein TraF n=1 Tax=Thiosulfativibrio zosterae TaxID=2675053 RepID=A0A6F8PJJ6_9GAMM|nr:conjugal transfer protein TraF [Thiosulfativibrio zosterae]BBP42281.1 hypothetical protein THMIRHAT_00270 [Thiosulfativibrio zosterae]
MNKKILVSALLLTSSSVLAAPSYSTIGPNIGYGSNSNPGTVYSSLTNPANNTINAADVDGSRYGLGLNLQVQAELFGVEGSSDFLDNNIKTILDKSSYTIQDALNLQTNTNQFFTDYNGGNINVIAGVTAPILFKSDFINGGISFDYTKQVGTKVSFIKKADLAITATSPTTFSTTTGAAAIGITVNQLDEFALSYGYDFGEFSTSDLRGKVAAGATIRLLSLTSNAQAIDFGQYINDNQGNQSKDISDYVDDITSGSSSSSVALDLGASWTADNYGLSVVAYNLNSPSFDIKRNAAAIAFGMDKTLTFDPQVRLGADLFSKNREWALSSSIDLMETKDLNGSDTKFWGISGSYSTNSAWYIPDVRLGLKGNMVGTGLTYMNLGTTLGFLNVDLSTSSFSIIDNMDSQKDSGAAISVGVEFDF